MKTTAKQPPTRTINEPMSLRITDGRDPKRAQKFAETLDRRRSNASEVLRALIDAYIASGGRLEFPVRLVELNGHNGRNGDRAKMQAVGRRI